MLKYLAPVLCLLAAPALAQGMMVKKLDPALDAVPSSMDQAHLPQPCGVCDENVVVHDGRDVFGNKGVEIETTVDGEA